MRIISLLALSLLFAVSADAGVVTISALPDTVEQGNTLCIKAVFAKSPDLVTGDFLGKRIPFFPLDSLTYRALIGVPVTSPPGSHKMVVCAHTKDAQLESHFYISISPVEFKKDTIELPEPTMSKLTSENLVKEGNVIGPKFKTCSPEKMWEMRFALPAKGPISSPFGSRRVYADGKMSWHHKGIDIAASLGDTVFACAAGAVILCRDFVVHGKTVMIDHGQGVVSIYCHLNQIVVKEGDVLKRGDSLGTIGQTGISTGPHVHWGVSVGNVRVDPIEWVERTIR